MTIGTVMRNVKTIGKDQPIREFLDLVLEGSDVIAVVDENGKAVGVLVERDILRLLKRHVPGMGAMVAETVVKSDLDGPASSLMTESLLTVLPDTAFKEAFRLMAERDSRYLLVVDADGKPLGSLHIASLVKKMVGGV